jgi:hypothetical protein
MMILVGCVEGLTEVMRYSFRGTGRFRWLLTTVLLGSSIGCYRIVLEVGAMVKMEQMISRK